MRTVSYNGQKIFCGNQKIIDFSRNYFDCQEMKNIEKNIKAYKKL